jgi:hypothetical protein
MIKNILLEVEFRGEPARTALHIKNELPATFMSIEIIVYSAILDINLLDRLDF